MSFLLTQDVADDSWNMVQSSISRLIETGIFGDHNHLHVVIGKPIPPRGIGTQEWWNENGILFEGSIGDRNLWKEDYQKIARSKCYLAWLWQKPTRDIPAFLLVEKDTHYWGSVILDGIPVSASGFDPCYDEMVSIWVAAACRAACLKQQGLLPAQFPNGFIEPK